MNRKNIILTIAATVAAFIALLSTRIAFNFDSTVEGLFILDGEKGRWYEVTDDLTPEDAKRLRWAMPLYPFRKNVERSRCVDSSQPCIDFRWDKAHGKGFIRNTWPDGSKLVVNLSRFRDSKGAYPAGIFIGGGLPPTDPDYRFMNNEATGMTYFDGRRWYHIWCNSNEGIIDPARPFIPIYPMEWAFKGSRVVENDGRNLTIESRHRIQFNGIPLDAQRVLFYTAGTSYVILTTEFTNRGSLPVTFQYMYGDEPWIGDFGSSEGDVGWSGKGLILTEHELNPQLQTYFGMFDYGNHLAGEEHRYTGKANFIEWERSTAPSRAIIANSSGGIANHRTPTPLTNPNNRFISLQYGPLTLMPGKSFSFTIAVGMSGNDPKTGFPVKPVTGLNP